MTDLALKNAQERRDALFAEISKLKEDIMTKTQDLENAEAFISAWYDFAGVAAPPEDNPVSSVRLSSSHESSATRRKKATGNPPKEEVVEVTRQLIAERGVPLSRANLLDLLQRYGLVIDGADPGKVLSTMLWRMPQKIARLKKYGYWLAEQDYPPAGYTGIDPNEDLDLRNDEEQLFRHEP